MLHVQLDLNPQTTVGDLRAFLELAAEAPNTAPVDLIYDDQDGGVTGIATDVVR